MKILLAADGSPFTRKALAFLVTHEGLASAKDELLVLNVQPPVPPRVNAFAGSDAVASYHRDEAEAVINPIKTFLQHHQIPFECRWVVGDPCDEIVAAATRDKAQLIVMGTHGHGLVGRFFMGSVAQRVVARSEAPVLLVK